MVLNVMGSNPIRHPNRKEPSLRLFSLFKPSRQQYCLSHREQQHAIQPSKWGFAGAMAYGGEPLRTKMCSIRQIMMIDVRDGLHVLEFPFYFESKLLDISALVHPDELGDIIATAFCFFDYRFQQVRIRHRST